MKEIISQGYVRKGGLSNSNTNLKPDIKPSGTNPVK